MTPLISILIPAYNAERWIADSIASAVAQTWPRKEIIVVDDGSTDRTLAVARRFASSGVVVITQDNQGAAAARNRAFSLCQGDYIQWFDADDLLAPDKVARQMEACGRGSTERTLLSCGWAYFMNRPHRARFIPSPLWCDLTPTEWLIRKMGHNLHMQTATWLVTRTLTEAGGPWDAGLAVDDDGEYFSRILLASDGVRFISEGRVYYRMGGPAHLGYIGRSPRKIESQFRSMRLHIQYLLSLEDSPRAREACVRYLQTWFHHFYPERRDIVEQAERMARELGGQLNAPQLSWEYDRIRQWFGWGAAKATRRLVRNVRRSVFMGWDGALARVERLTVPRGNH